MAQECPGPNPPSVSMLAKTMAKTTPGKGKAWKEVAEEVKEEEESEEEQLMKKEKKKVQRTKASSSQSTPSIPPASSDADDEEPPSYHTTHMSIMKTLSHFPSEQHSQLTNSLTGESF